MAEIQAGDRVARTKKPRAPRANMVKKVVSAFDTSVTPAAIAAVPTEQIMTPAFEQPGPPPDVQATPGGSNKIMLAIGALVAAALVFYVLKKGKK